MLGHSPIEQINVCKGMIHELLERDLKLSARWHLTGMQRREGVVGSEANRNFPSQDAAAAQLHPCEGEGSWLPDPPGFRGKSEI